MAPLHYVGSPDNDLVRVASACGIELRHAPSLAVAIESSASGGGVLLLADSYPRPAGIVDAAAIDQLQAKQLRLFAEYPEQVAGLSLGEPRPTQWERAVVASSMFAPAVESSRILALHGCWYLPVAEAIDAPHLVVARVAGYHEAVYGLPDDAAPALFELPDAPVLVATTKLSGFRTARYGPQPAWAAIWSRLLGWLLDEPGPELSWDPSVALTARRDQPLADGAESIAFDRSVRWFADHVVYSIDWKKGAAEGYESGIDHRGRQLRRAWVRGDCTGETAMLFAWHWATRRDPSSQQRAGQVLDYVLSAPDFYHDDPKDPAWGLTNWFERGGVFYGDDNARVLMPALTVARLLDDDRWDERILRSVLGNLRTTGPLGFRRPRVNLEDLLAAGWAPLQDEETTHFAPHYQAYLWATFLWAHALTGDDELLAKPRNAITMTMERYPEGWRWTNGIAQERARLLLALAFLVRVDDTPQHRAWLRQMCDDVLSAMDASGAIREELGDLGSGAYGPPASNEAYGTSEATLIQSNGDAACDLLYTTNFAFLGLHEAAAVLGDADLHEAMDRLAAFLCRIQVCSTDQPYLDGAWLRSFDFDLWEYWGSSADLGWGAWSVESGWTNTWIASVLAMREAGQTLFDTSLKDRLAPRWPALREEMMDRSRPLNLSAADGPAGEAPGAE